MSLITQPTRHRIDSPGGQPRRAAGARLFSLSEHAIKLIMAGLVGFDALLSAALFVLAYRLRHREPVFAGPGLSSEAGFDPNFGPYLSVLYFVPLIQVALFWYRGLYRVRGEFSLSEDFINVFKAVSVGALLVTVLAFFYRGGFAYQAFSYSRLVFLAYYGLALLAFTAERVALRSLQSFYRRRQRNVIPILVAGANGVAETCLAEIAHDPRLGRQVVGVVTPDGRPPRPEGLRHWPTLGRYDELHRLIRRHGVREVLITDPAFDPQLIFDTMVKCGRGQRVAWRVVPNLLDCIPRKACVEQLGAVPMVRLFEDPLSGPARALKRGVDLAVSAALLLLSAPLWLLIAIAIRRDSRGPVFYRQERVGMDGHVFLLYKFRSMQRASARDKEHRRYMARLIRNEGPTNLGTPERPVYKFTNGRRVTRVGRLLRRLSLDELPQLYNVFKGEMSLVGPRPPLPYEVAHYAPWHRKRLDVKPGLTGLWQVSGRYRLSFEQMVQLDIYYIENWSFWLDLKIILKTLPALFHGERI